MGLANKITIVRILLVPFLLICFFYYTPETAYLRYIALSIFVICSLTDGIDGYIAKKYYQRTKLGAILDPIADKILVLTAFISLSAIGNIPAASKIPVWLTIIVISRDFVILLGSLVIFIIIKDLRIQPSRLGKITTFFHITTVIAALLRITPGLYLWIATAFFTTASGIGYIWFGMKALNNETYAK